MHLWCQTSLFFPHLSVVKSYRYGCRDLQHWKCCGEFLRRDVENCRHHSWNQHLTPAVAKPTTPVAKLISFAAAGAPLLPWSAGPLDPGSPLGTTPRGPAGALQLSGAAGRGVLAQRAHRPWGLPTSSAASPKLGK